MKIVYFICLLSISLSLFASKRDDHLEAHLIREASIIRMNTQRKENFLNFMSSVGKMKSCSVQYFSYSQFFLEVAKRQIDLNNKCKNTVSLDEDSYRECIGIANGLKVLISARKKNNYGTGCLNQPGIIDEYEGSIVKINDDVKIVLKDLRRKYRKFLAEDMALSRKNHISKIELRAKEFQCENDYRDLSSSIISKGASVRMDIYTKDIYSLGVNLSKADEVVKKIKNLIILCGLEKTVELREIDSKLLSFREQFALITPEDSFSRICKILKARRNMDSLSIKLCSNFLDNQSFRYSLSQVLNKSLTSKRGKNDE